MLNDYINTCYSFGQGSILTIICNTQSTLLHINMPNKYLSMFEVVSLCLILDFLYVLSCLVIFIWFGDPGWGMGGGGYQGVVREFFDVNEVNKQYNI